MFTADEYAARQAEVMRAASQDDAVRLSAELLAKTDEQLRQQLNARSVQPLCAANFGSACALHCDLLSAAGLAADCYATALTGLLVLDIAAQHPIAAPSLDCAEAQTAGPSLDCAEAQGASVPNRPSIAEATLPQTFALTTLALTAFGELTAQMPHDEYTEQHVPALYTLWASRLYILYQSVNKGAVLLRHLVQAAHQMLEALIEADIVRWPNVDIQGREVPALSSEALGDIFARSLALGLVEGGGGGN